MPRDSVGWQAARLHAEVPAVHATAYSAMPGFQAACRRAARLPRVSRCQIPSWGQPVGMRPRGGGPPLLRFCPAAGAAGKREADERNRLTLPSHLSLKNLERITAAAGQTEGEPADGSKFGRHFSKLIDDSLTWDFIPWLKSVSRLPVLVKVSWSFASWDNPSLTDSLSLLHRVAWANMGREV